jgi:hypothetical protein
VYVRGLLTARTDSEITTKNSPQLTQYKMLLKQKVREI